MSDITEQDLGGETARPYTMRPDQTLREIAVDFLVLRARLDDVPGSRCARLPGDDPDVGEHVPEVYEIAAALDIIVQILEAAGGWVQHGDHGAAHVYGPDRTLLAGT